MKEFKINEQILIGTLQYLYTKPFGEVRQLIEILEKLEGLDSPPMELK